MNTERELLDLLKEIGIDFEYYKHKPIYSVDDAIKYANDIPGAHCKNLFIKDIKDNFYLVITLDKKRVDLKNISRQINCKRLSFSSPESLREYLGVEPGCVTPFGLINDIKHKVEVLLDKDLLNEKEVSFHPLVNSATITIELIDLFKFIDYCGQKKTIIENMKN